MPVVLLMGERKSDLTVSNSCSIVEMVPELIPARQIDVLWSLLLLQDLTYAVLKTPIWWFSTSNVFHARSLQWQTCSCMRLVELGQHLLHLSFTLCNAMHSLISP